MSVPARAFGSTPAHPTPERGVTTIDHDRDPAALLAAAAANPSISDRALRVFTVVATTYDRGVTAAQIADTIPSLTEGQASRLLGALVTAGVLEKRLQTYGYKPDGARRRRGLYTLTGVEQ